MNKNTLFELTLFDPANTLINLIEKQNIEYTKIPKTQKFVMATDETIEIVNQGSSEKLIENIGLIFIEWLNEKQCRKVQVQLVNGSIVYIEEYEIKGVINILKHSLKVTAFDPEYNNQILNKKNNRS